MTASAGRIGSYRLQRVLGTGSFATVWLAHDEDLDAPVAVKVLADNWARNADVRRRFTQEARLLRRIRDERVVGVHTVGETGDGRPYLVMEWADRASLAERLAGRPGRRLGVGEAVDLALAVADGLAVVHTYGVVHRDVKPSNILFRSLAAHRRRPGRDESVLLADFGLARDTTEVSGFTLAAGTPAYMAPEQTVASASVGVRADLYSLVAVLYETLTGVAAHQATTIAAAGAAARRPPPPLAGLRPEAAGLQEVIDRGLDADPDRRFASAAELAAAIVDHAGDRAAVPDPDGRAVAFPPPRAGRPAGSRPAPPGPADPTGGADLLTGVDPLDVVDALIGQAGSVLPDRAGTWSAASDALRRPLRIAVAADADPDGSVAAALAAGPFELLGGWDRRGWPGAEIVVVGGPGPWTAPPGAPRPDGPVRVVATGAEPGASPAGRRELDPEARRAATELVAWVAADADAWGPTVLAGAALRTVTDALAGAAGSPAAEELAGRAELIGLANPDLEAVAALRAEVAGLLGVTGAERAEARRALTPGPPALRVGLGPDAPPGAVRRLAAARAGHWRTLINRGRVPYAGRPAATAVARVYDHLALG